MSNASTSHPSSADTVLVEVEPTQTLPPDEAVERAPASLGRGPAPGPDGWSGASIKHYEIIRPLGRGGMGVVYLARDTKLGRLVALKLLLRHGATDARRLLSEARATARCKHENIVVIYEVDEHLGAPYLVLEYVEGTTLRASMAQRARAAEAADAPLGLSPGLAVELMLPVVRALVCAHEQGIVHRDLKPENILLGDSGRVKVVDFGIAAQLCAEAASADAGAAPAANDATHGTLLYMAPEQWRDEALDHRVDLWAVGVMLFELCAGTHPLAPGSLGQLARVMNLDAPMPSLRELCPAAGALAAVVDRCLAKRKEARFDSARELLGALEALLADRDPLAAGEGANPFLGLSAFQEADAARFFGRDADVAGVLQTLRSQPLLTMVGASGAGKSSFVRAGVIPALKRLGERWQAFVVRPGRRPLAALAEVLAQVSEAPPSGESAGGAAGDLAAALRERPGRLGAQLRADCRRRHGKALLFVDQFEELYTLGADADERAAFLACLEGVADDASSPLRVVLALRSDFLDRLADDRNRLPGALRGLVLLSPMGRDGLREVLTRPIEAAGYRPESEALVGRMLDALEGTRSPLPLLQFAATTLWQQRDRERRLLTEASYERLGGVAGALSAHADAVLAGLSTEELHSCRDTLLRLVTPQRTRAVVSLGELHHAPGRGEGSAGDVGPVVQHLLDARLLSIETGDSPEDATVELVHESLIDRWPTLGRWLDESTHDAQFLARLRATAQQWEASGEAEGLLWRDDAAAEARAWLERRRAERGGEGAGLGPREERYLKAVVALSQRARVRRRRAVAGLFAALTATAATVSLLAVRAGREADRANREAGRANHEAVRARNATRLAAARELQADPTTVLSLVRELEPPELPRDWATMADWALRRGVAEATLTYQDIVNSVAFSPDGRRLVAASRDKTLRVVRADGRGEPLVLRGHEGSVVAASFAPDGRRIVSASYDGTVRIWPADGPGDPLVLRGDGGAVVSAEFSPDGRSVVSASRDRAVRVWRADGAGAPLLLRGHEGTVNSASFSPDGQRIVTASSDRTARVWHADGTGEPLVLRGHKGPVTFASFSPDGRHVLSASDDKTVRVVRADGTGDPVVFRDHEGAVWSAAWGPGGQYVASASGDKTVRLWRADGSGDTVVLQGHGEVVHAVAFSPDGRHVASASGDKTVRLWRTNDARRAVALRGHEGATDVAFSADGRRLLVGHDRQPPQLWNADGTGAPLALRGPDGALSTAAVSPDGRRAVAVFSDETARVSNADGAGDLVLLEGHTEPIYAAAFSPDGHHVLTGSSDKTARLWDATAPAPSIVLGGHERTVSAVAFSPDGRRVATGSNDKTVRLWNADGQGDPLVLRGHEDNVTSVTFSPDGRHLVTTSYDGTARVFRADGTGEPLVFRGHESRVFDAAFSPDGSRFVTASLDRTVRLWRTDGTGEPSVFSHDAPVFAVAFSPDGQRLASATDDTTWVWPIPEPLRGVDDPKLWTATTYCLPVERRIALLNVTEAQARADEQACLRRVDAARPTP
jgi:WD40 repeat protein/tRNA A-37 threonylcarbamoyl transferase component Bud32